MQVSTDLIMWNGVHMQSHAKIHLVAVLTGEIVKSNVPEVFLRFASSLVTKFGRSLTPVDSRFITSFHCDYGTRCVQMKTMHSAVLLLASSENLPYLTSLVL